VTFAITGTQGVLAVDAFNQKVMLYDAGEGSSNEVCFGDDMDRFLIKDFVECVASGREPHITGRDGLEALRIALAAYESAETLQPVAVSR